jgi:hypothetical protein
MKGLCVYIIDPFIIVLLLTRNAVVESKMLSSIYNNLPYMTLISSQLLHAFPILSAVLISAPWNVSTSNDLSGL